MSSNFLIDISSEGEKRLQQAFHLRMEPDGRYASQKADTAIGYVIDPELGMVFFQWKPSGEFAPFPFKMDADGCAAFAFRWLAEAEYPREPDHDGDNHKGWRFYNEAWGHVGHYRSEALIAVKPEWQMYGK